MSMTIGHGFYKTNSFNKTDMNVKNQNITAEEASKDIVVRAEELKANSFRTKQPEISEKAQNLLKKLQNEYGSKMDFMIYGNDQDPKELLPYAAKEYTVLFSAEELEHMANDSEYEKECMNSVENAIKMSDKICETYGYKSVFDEKTDGTQLTRIGISFNNDGTLTYFAELEKMTDKQLERAEELRQKKLEERKAEKKDKAEKSEKNEKTEHKRQTVKRTFVEANSEDELLKKIGGIDWENIPEKLLISGSKFNMSV